MWSENYKFDIGQHVILEETEGILFGDYTPKAIVVGRLRKYAVNFYFVKLLEPDVLVGNVSEETARSFYSPTGFPLPEYRLKRYIW